MTSSWALVRVGEAERPREGAGSVLCLDTRWLADGILHPHDATHPLAASKTPAAAMEAEKVRRSIDSGLSYVWSGFKHCHGAAPDVNDTLLSVNRSITTLGILARTSSTSPQQRPARATQLSRAGFRTI